MSFTTKVHLEKNLNVLDRVDSEKNEEVDVVHLSTALQTLSDSYETLSSEENHIGRLHRAQVHQNVYEYEKSAIVIVSSAFDGGTDGVDLEQVE